MNTILTLYICLYSILSIAQINEVEMLPDGIIFPRMNTAQRNALSPVEGQAIYNTQTNTIESYDGSQWTTGSSNSTPSIVSDSDGDTYIDTEESTDDDIIRFKVKALEVMRHDGQTLHFINNGQSVFIGENAGVADDLSDNRNTFVGSLSGQANTIGTQNVAVGHQALKANITGSSNIAIGLQALQKNKNSNNVAIGFNAARDNNNGNKNIAIGHFSGFVNQDGNQNTFIGYEAGRNTSTTTSGSVMIGHQAGMNEVANDRLYIANDNTTAPLIYGEFDNGKVEMNANTEVNGDAQINGTLKVNDPTQTGYALPTTDGIADQVLQTNGNGSVAWSALPSSNSGTSTCVDTEPHSALPIGKREFYMKIDEAPSNHPNGYAGLDQKEIISYGYEFKQLPGNSGNSCNNLFFKIRKEVDRATPKLRKMTYTGQILIDPILYVFQELNNQIKSELKFEFDELIINSVETKVMYAGNNQYRLYEVIDFKVTDNLKIVYYLYDPNTGQPTGTIEEEFNCTN